MRQFDGYMHGINLGGWLSQKDSNTKEYTDTFITEEDSRHIAELGLDHVRIPVDYTTLETEADAEPIEAGYVYLDNAIRWCRQYGLHVLIDLHKTHGYSFDPLDKDVDPEAFFHTPAEQERFFSLWERIARRYRRDIDIVAFELLNEIVSPNIYEEWNNVADRAVERIRAITPDAWIVIGGIRYNNVTSVPLLHAPADNHIVFNFHCYEPLLFTHQKAFWVDNMPSDLDVAWPQSVGDYARIGEEVGISADLAGAVDKIRPEMQGSEIFDHLFLPATETAEKYNVPLYCGEYGVIDQAPPADTLVWLRDITAVFDKYGIGRALWTYKRKDFGLMDPHYDSVRKEMVKLL